MIEFSTPLTPFVSDFRSASPTRGSSKNGNQNLATKNNQRQHTHIQVGTGAKPTYFGRFLQKMPLDPDVGFLVMSGVRLKLVKERLAFEMFLVSL